MIKDDTIEYFEKFTTWEYVKVPEGDFDGSQLKDADGNFITNSEVEVTVQTCKETPDKEQTDVDRLQKCFWTRKHYRAIFNRQLNYQFKIN